MSHTRQPESMFIRTMITLLSVALCIATTGGCKHSVIDNNKDDEEPDESIDAAFVWRICNESEEYAMENVLVLDDSIMIGTLAAGKCSKFYPGPQGGEQPIDQIKYEQNWTEYWIVYLASRRASRGQIDSANTPIFLTPGRYTYYFTRDTSKFYTEWIEIEREAYH